MKSSSFPLFAILFLLVGRSQLDAQEPAAPVRTVTPRPAVAVQPYQIPGRTEPLETASIFTRATGIVQERRFDIGDAVKAGDVLAIIAVPEIDRAIDAARAAVEQTEVRAANARGLADRAASLLVSQATSREDAEQRTATAAELDAAVRVARAELARLEEQKKFATVRAPFDGIVAARNFDRGDRVRGDAATSEGWLYRLIRVDLLRFTLAASPDLALRIGSSDTATVRFNEFPGRAFAATIARASRMFDPVSGTMRIELSLENKDLLLPAGLTGTAVFDLRSSRPVVLVPTNTLLVREGRSFVATVDGGKVAFVEVTRGRNFGAEVEVTAENLATETPVIINPNALLRAGDSVDAKPLTPAS